MRHAAIVNFNNRKDVSIRVAQSHRRKPVRSGPGLGLQELHLLFKLMELPVNGVRSVTSSGAIAALYFVKTRGVPGNWSFTLSLKLVTETGLKGKAKKTLIYRT